MLEKQNYFLCAEINFMNYIPKAEKAFELNKKYIPKSYIMVMDNRTKMIGVYFL